MSAVIGFGSSSALTNREPNLFGSPLTPKIDVRSYGVRNDGTPSGAILETLLDRIADDLSPVSNLGGAIVELPPGDIALEVPVTLVRHKIAIEGAGSYITRFWDRTNGSYPALIKMAPGYNSNARLQGFSIHGGTMGGDPLGPSLHPGMIGMLLTAVAGGDSTGGLSNSKIIDVDITGFIPATRWVGGNNGLLPIQSITVSDAFWSIPAAGNVFETRGQVQSSGFKRVEFYTGRAGAYGQSTSSGVAIVIGDPADSWWGNGITFDTCKVTGGYQVLKATQSTQINYINGWAENLRRGFEYAASFSGGTVANNEFDNVAWSGDSGEWLLNIGANGEVRYHNNLHTCSSGINVKGATGHAGAVVSWCDNRFHQGVTTEIETVIRRRSINGVYEFVCTGTPEGVFAAPVGSRAWRLDGGATTTLYVKTSGTGNTGWTAK